MSSFGTLERGQQIQPDAIPLTSGVRNRQKRLLIVDPESPTNPINLRIPPDQQISRLMKMALLPLQPPIQEINITGQTPLPPFDNIYGLLLLSGASQLPVDYTQPGQKELKEYVEQILRRNSDPNQSHISIAGFGGFAHDFLFKMHGGGYHPIPTRIAGARTMQKTPEAAGDKLLEGIANEFPLWNADSAAMSNLGKIPQGHQRHVLAMEKNAFGFISPEIVAVEVSHNPPFARQVSLYTTPNRPELTAAALNTLQASGFQPNPQIQANGRKIITNWATMAANHA